VSFPRGVFWPYRPTYGSAEPTTRGPWARIGWVWLFCDELPNALGVEPLLVQLNMCCPVLVKVA